MKIQYDTESLLLDPEEAPNLLLLAIRHRIPIGHSCEGMASCGTCRVIITEGVETLPTRNSLEQEMADDRGFAPNERLACQLDLDDVSHDFAFKLPLDD